MPHSLSELQLQENNAGSACYPPNLDSLKCKRPLAASTITLDSSISSPPAAKKHCATYNLNSADISLSSVVSLVSPIRRKRRIDLLGYDTKDADHYVSDAKTARCIEEQPFTIAELTSHPLTARSWLSLSEYVPLGPCFTAITYNLLSYTCEQCAHHQQLCREFDWLQADVVCFQNVQLTYFQSALEQTLKERGYSTVFSLFGSTTGVCTAWKNSLFYQDSTSIKFDLCGAFDDILNELDAQPLRRQTVSKLRGHITFAGNVSPAGSMIISLRTLFTNRLLVVANMQVTSAENRADLRAGQCAGVLRAMVHQDSSAAYLLTGDLNSNPDSAALQLIQDGYLSESNLRELQSLQIVNDNDAIVNLLWPAFQHPIVGLESIYLVGRDHRLVSSGFDFMINSTSQLRAHSILQLPDSNLSSNHFVLAARFEFL